MPQRVSVRSLVSLSLCRLSAATQDWVLGAARRIHGAGGEMVEVRKLTGQSVEEMQDWIFSHVARNIHSEATLAVLKGVELAVETSTKVSSDQRKIFIAVAFVDLVVSPHLEQLDLTDVSKILRLNFYDKLSSFRGLQHLVLGSGSGGWSSCYTDKFREGLGGMKRLNRFSLCYDCTDSILEVLAQNCRHCLRVLDVEMSAQVTDASVPAISSCKLINALHIHHTGLTSEGHATVLLSLPRLQLLVRGGFLCEAMEVVKRRLEKEKEGLCSLPQLELVEFWSSEDYFFHSDQQMELLSSMCPKMKKIMFQFSTDVMTNLLVLATFPYLTDLHLWGGDFYTDNILLLITQIGLQLNSLNLIHTENLDQQALESISQHCPHLVSLGFYNCEFQDRIRDRHSHNNEWGFPRVRDDGMQELLELESLAMVSECSNKFLLPLLVASLNLQHLKTGIHCQLSDSLLQEVLVKNSLQHLRSFNVPVSKHLSSLTISLLLEHCPNLASLQDLNYWEGITKDELRMIRMRLEEGNFALDVGVGLKEAEYQRHIDDLSDEVIEYLQGY